MFPVINGQITRRLIVQLGPADPAWTPPRTASTPPTTRRPTDTWSATGRTERTHRR